MADFLKKLNTLHFFNKWMRQDTRLLRKYLLSGDTVSQTRALAKIALRLHVIEKGLSMSGMKPGFGTDNILLLCGLCEQYRIRFDESEEVFLRAIAVLKEYVLRQDAAGADISASRAAIEALISHYPSIGPSSQTEVDPGTYFDGPRHSVRSFSSSPLDPGKLEAAVSEAVSKAPSACNRQSERIYIVTGRKKREKIMKLHNGSRGFGDKATAIIVINVELQCYFNALERNLCYTDSGIFAQSLLDSLHRNRIAACPLNWCASKSDSRKLRSIIGSPASEKTTLLVACGNLPEEKFLIAASERISPSKVIRTLK